MFGVNAVPDLITFIIWLIGAGIVMGTMMALDEHSSEFPLGTFIISLMWPMIAVGLVAGVILLGPFALIAGATYWAITAIKKRSSEGYQ